ncbi:MAG: PepSY-associated TM helix domain-containing protein [Lacunisphaera sp.]
MKLFRQIIFWSHLVIGLTGGLVIAMMAVTGTTMAFEKQLVAWAERDVALVKSTDAPRRPLDELQKAFRAAQPESRLSAITVSANPAAALIFTAGREDIFYVDPYSGEIHPASAPKLRSFLHTMEECHRWLTLSGDKRNLGKAVTGAAASLFLLLAISGLYLWWPRSLSWRGFKAGLAFNFQLAGKARDFNWHNVIGFWCLPMLLITTLTGVIMSYRWANDALFRLAGTEPPAQEAPPAQPVFEIKRPSPDARPLGYDVLLASVRKDFPLWDSMTLRVGGNQRGQRPGGNTAAGVPAAGANAPTPAKTGSPGAAAQNPEARRERPAGGGGGAGEPRRGPQPVALSVHESNQWPRTASTALTLNPFTGEVLKREAFSDQSTGRQARFWARHLHTGEALGLVGQILQTISSLGALFLVYTGFALGWRRFFNKQKSAPAAQPRPDRGMPFILRKLLPISFENESRLQRLSSSKSFFCVSSLPFFVRRRLVPWNPSCGKNSKV